MLVTDGIGILLRNMVREVLHQDGLGPPQTRVKKHETRNKKQNRLAHSQFIVWFTPKQKKTLLDSRIMFKRNMCETANQQYIWSHMVVYMVSKMRCCWLTFRRCFVSRVHYPEIGHFEMPTRLDTCLFDSQTMFSGTLFIVMGWRRRVWKTVLFRVSHLFSVFWLSFAAALSG